MNGRMDHADKCIDELVDHIDFLISKMGPKGEIIYEGCSTHIAEK
jgi:hypothetical protein